MYHIYMAIIYTMAISSINNNVYMLINIRAQVVGWPPVRNYRKNIMAQKSNTDEPEKVAATTATFVKVSMDGAPYLRKVDLKMYTSYQELADALAKMFSSFTMGTYMLVQYSLLYNLPYLCRTFYCIYLFKQKDFIQVYL